METYNEENDQLSMKIISLRAQQAKNQNDIISYVISQNTEDSQGSSDTTNEFKAKQQYFYKIIQELFLEYQKKEGECQREVRHLEEGVESQREQGEQSDRETTHQKDTLLQHNQSLVQDNHSTREQITQMQLQLKSLQHSREQQQKVFQERFDQNIDITRLFSHRKQQQQLQKRI